METGTKNLAVALIACILIASAFVTGYWASESSHAGDAGANIIQSGGNDDSFTLLDDWGRTVEFPGVPERIVSLAPSNTELLYAVGAGDKVVAADTWSNYPPEAVAKANITTLPLSIEDVIVYEPDLVLLSAINENDLDDLEARGLRVFMLDPLGVRDVFRHVRLVGQLTGLLEGADALASELEARLDAVVNQTSLLYERPKVFIDLGGLWSAGPGTFPDDVINLAGGANIAAATGVEWPLTSREFIVKEEPDYVLYNNFSDFAYGSTPAGLENLTAVQNGSVHLIFDDWLSRPGPRVVDGVEQVFGLIHPELAVAKS